MFYLYAGLRLASNSNSSTGVQWEGRLEVYHNGQWGTVCDHAFDNVAASVACSAIGLSEMYVPLTVAFIDAYDMIILIKICNKCA